MPEVLRFGEWQPSFLGFGNRLLVSPMPCQNTLMIAVRRNRAFPTPWTVYRGRILYSDVCGLLGGQAAIRGDRSGPRNRGPTGYREPQFAFLATASAFVVACVTSTTGAPTSRANTGNRLEKPSRPLVVRMSGNLGYPRNHCRPRWQPGAQDVSRGVAKQPTAQSPNGANS